MSVVCKHSGFCIITISPVICLKPTLKGTHGLQYHLSSGSILINLINGNSCIKSSSLFSSEENRRYSTKCGRRIQWFGFKHTQDYGNTGTRIGVVV